MRKEPKCAFMNSEPCTVYDDGNTWCMTALSIYVLCIHRFTGSRMIIKGGGGGCIYLPLTFHNV